MNTRVAPVGILATLAMVLAMLTLTATGTSAALTTQAEAQQARTVERPVRWKPPTGGHFNNPFGDRAGRRGIENVIYDSVEHARKGSSIKIALFSFDRVRMKDALIRAHRRGVNVQILLNGHQTTTVMRQMRRVFGANRAKRSFIYQCERGCRGGSFLHSKMYLFSQTGAAEKVAMVGSVNLTTNAMVHQWNDLMVLIRPGVYDAANTVFDQMKKDVRARPIYQVFPIRDQFELHAFPHPNTTAQNDPVMKMLRKIRCGPVAKGYGRNGRTMIRIDQHRWAGERGAWIARKVVSLWGQGCDVRAMHGSVDYHTKRPLSARTKRGLMPLRSNGFDYDQDDFLDMYTHHKYMTVSGNYAGNRATNITLTGSSNWAGIGVTGDEILFTAKGARFVRQWNRNFDFIWNNHTRPVHYRREVHGRTTASAYPAEPKIGGEHWEND